MPNKILTAKVRFDTKSAEANLTRLSKKINAINNALNKKVGKTGLDTQISKARIQQEKLRQSVLKTQQAELKVTEQKHKTALAAQRVKDATDRTNKSANSLLNTMRRVAGVYLGIQTARAAINASDVLTSAKNRFNNLEGGSPEKTAESMDKIYSAAQRSRTGYGDMLSNVSKTMTLAGDSFQNNIDNAIRFQEIMAKAYTVGGASDTEASTSMYQLVQALGSGVLQGDELRSVREGAPLAYKAIEKFAQGVYDTDESLKQLAADGKVTSEMVVAAIMDADFSGKLEEQFENTEATFEQTFTRIKNMAMKAFEPALEKINKLLNSEKGQKAIEGIGYALVALGNILYGVTNIFVSFFSWCVDNWEWFKYVAVGALIVITAYLIWMSRKAIMTAIANIGAFVSQYWSMILIVAAVMAILYVYELWRQGTITTTDAIVYCLLLIAAVFVVLAITSLGWIGLIIAAIIAAVAAILYYFEYVAGAITWFGLMMRDVGLSIANFFIACWNWVCAAGGNALKGIANFAIALGNAIDAICTNIGVAFSNAWIWAKNSFWEFLASVIDGVSRLEPVINGIAKLLGKEGVDFGALSSSIRSKKEEYKEFVSVGDAWNSGMNTYQYADLGEAWSSGMNTYDAFEEGWSQEYFNVGYNWGSGLKDAVNEWGSQFQAASGDENYSGIFSDISNLLGDNSLPNVTDPAYDIVGAWDEPTVDELLGSVNDIKDSMDIADDDLEWMRKIAEMEWRNEFTTAEIKVDMTNNNTVNSDRDLDGIVEYLSDVLRDEMTSVAYGVHY